MRKLLLMMAALAAIGAAASAPAEAFMDRPIGHEIIKPFVPAPGELQKGGPSRYATIPGCAAFGSGCGIRKFHQVICVDYERVVNWRRPQSVAYRCTRWRYVY